MGVASIEYLDVQRDPSMMAKSTKKLRNELRFELSDPWGELGHIVDEKRPVGEVQNHSGASLIHGYHGMPVALNPLSVPQGSDEGISKTDTHVFHRVMGIDFQVSRRPDREIEQTMVGKKGQHVLQKRDPGPNIGVAPTINGEIQLDVGFLCLALHTPCTLYSTHSLIRSEYLIIRFHPRKFPLP